MHDAARDFTFNAFFDWRSKDNNDYKKFDILEIGSLNINGGIRELLTDYAKSYVGIDAQDGPGVDIKIDAVNYTKLRTYDVVVCNEVFEHTPDYAKIIYNAMISLRDGGIFIATMAGEGRPPHSALDELPIREWEHYRNVGEWELRQLLHGYFSGDVVVDKLGTDLRCWAVKK